MNSAANTARTSPAPCADQPTYTSWRLAGKSHGYDHEIVFMVDKSGDKVAMVHTYFGARKTASGGQYNAEQVVMGTRESARVEYRALLEKGYRA